MLDTRTEENKTEELISMLERNEATGMSIDYYALKTLEKIQSLEKVNKNLIAFNKEVISALTKIDAKFDELEEKINAISNK